MNLKDDAPGRSCAYALTEWLKKSIKGSLKHARFSNHPADQSRKRLLEDFVSGKTDSIPAVIGIKMLRPHDTGAVDLGRVQEKNGPLIHRYRADPAVIAKIVCYSKGDKGWNFDKPIVFDWRQSWKVVPFNKTNVPPVPDGPLKGRCFGDPRINKSKWIEALEEYLKGVGIGQYTFVRQGNVAIYENGESRYIRNFSGTQGFKPSFLKGIVGIKRSPFSKRVIENRIIN